MLVNAIRGLIFIKIITNELVFLRETVTIQWNAWKRKDFLLLANKLIDKIPGPPNAKEHYQPFIRKKNSKWVKQLKVITYQPKTFENPNNVDIKSFITEHPNFT